MLAYVFWHRAAHGVEQDEYEGALRRFHASLAGNPPSGLLGSASLRAQALPWLTGEGGWSAGGYEDWYLVAGWDALGVLESAAVSRGHEGAHEQAAKRFGSGTGALYKHLQGEGQPARARLATWVGRPPHTHGSGIEDLLEDGLEPGQSSLWQRCLLLGPAPELCLLSSAAELPADSGLAPGRLPQGWDLLTGSREALPDA